MLTVILRRVLASIPVLFLVSFGVFVLADLAPGDLATNVAGPYATDEQVAAVREELGLNDPLLVRYAHWLGNAVQGDLGHAVTTHESVSQIIGDRVPVTLSIAGVTVLLTILGGLVIGLLSAARQNGALDRLSTGVTVLGLTLPEFWVAILLVTWLAVDRGWFPAVGYVPFADGLWPWLHALILPAGALSIHPAAEVGRQLRAAMHHEMGEQYVLSARAKGLSTQTIVGKHALKNAAVPVVTILGFRTAQLLGGVAIIEQIFVLPGLGEMAVAAVQNRDIVVLQGVVVFTTLVVVLINLVVDISYTYFNPRVRT